MKLLELKKNLNKKSNFVIKEISKNLFLVKHNNRKESALSFLRFQEFYESPKYKNKKIKINEFYNYYKKKYKRFTYHKDWAGFNVPLKIINAFKKKHNLFEKEKQIFSSFNKNKNSYIIGVNKKEPKNTYMHEVAHGLFYLNRNYKKEVLALLKNKDLNDIKKVLLKMGYHRSVLSDEIQAYMCFSLKDLKNYGLKNIKQYEKLRNEIIKTFKKYI